MLRRLTIPVILGYLLGVGIARPQSQPHLAGVIRDPTDAAVPDAAVTIVNQDTGFRRLTTSRADGSYSVGLLEAGLYKVTVRHPGFRTLIRLGVRMDPAQPVRVDFNLPLGSMQESITVEDSPTVLLQDEPGVGTLITQDQIDRIPSSGHDLTNLLE